MKNLFYTLYALFFNLNRLLFPLRKNRVAFVSMHNENFCDALGAVRDEMEKRGGYDFVYITRQDLSLKNPMKALAFFLFKSRLLATAEYVFLNDCFHQQRNFAFDFCMLFSAAFAVDNRRKLRCLKKFFMIITICM